LEMQDDENDEGLLYQQSLFSGAHIQLSRGTYSLPRDLQQARSIHHSKN
jgi:hypothetical protein